MSSPAEFIAPGEQPWSIEHPFTEIERLFIFRRPFDSLNRSAVRAHSTVQQVQKERRHFDALNLPAEVIELNTSVDIQDTVHEFNRYGISKHDAVMAIGGDGIASNTNAAAQRAGFDGPIVHVGRGNACDMAHMLFRGRDIRQPVGSMLRSRLVDIYTLDITTDKPEIGTGAVAINASGYLSFGRFIHDVTQEVGSRTFRAKTENMGELAKLQAETAMMLGKLGCSAQVILKDDCGSKREVSDVVFPNGQRMAKKVRFGGVNLLRPGFGRLELSRSTAPAVLWGLGKATVGAFKHFKPEETYAFSLSNEDESPVVGQRDGELVSYPSGTEFTISLSDRTVSLATTR